MKSLHAVAIAAVLAAAGCGGKSRAEPADPGGRGDDGHCCCATGDGREKLDETACTEAGGSCEPVDTCETEGVGGEGVGDEPIPEADPTDY